MAFLLIHTSTRVSGEQQDTQNTTLVMVWVEPVVPHLTAHFEGGGLHGPLQPLDGIDCDGCVIEASVITYAGGAFSCNGCSIHTDRIELKGAAINTFNLLKAVGAMPGPTPAPKNRKPLNDEANMIKISPQERVTWVSLAGLKQ